MNSRQLHRLATDPQAMMRFKTTGEGPREKALTSPLIRFLEAIPGRDRAHIGPVRLTPDLGYRIDTHFRSLEVLYRWLKPQGLLEGE